MGYKKVDSTVVHFDTSEPKVFNPKIKLNINSGKLPFSGRYDTVV